MKIARRRIIGRGTPKIQSSAPRPKPMVASYVLFSIETFWPPVGFLPFRGPEDQQRPHLTPIEIKQIEAAIEE